jgi:ABC-type sugar transport system substrate-binding protein
VSSISRRTASSAASGSRASIAFTIARCRRPARGYERELLEEYAKIVRSTAVKISVNVYNGAKQAAADLGANVRYVWSNWDPGTMVSQFKSAIATNPAGIAVMGHPGDAALKPWVTKAESKGIIVTSQNTELPTLFKAYQAKGFGYVGQITAYVSSHPDVKLVVTDHGAVTPTAET